MQALEQRFNLVTFFRRVAHAPKRLLMLDYDGTLAPFHVDPAKAKPYPGMSERLDAIMEDPRTQVVVISGRWIRDLIPLLNTRELPEIWGSHGWEQLRVGGEYAVAPIGRDALVSLAETDDWADAIRRHGGRCERKPGALAIHWRGLSVAQIADIRRTLYQRWASHRLYQDLVWHEFDGGIELRAPERHKAYVVDTLLNELGDGVSAYLGDDTTDEDAFKAIAGRGLGVLVRPVYRPTLAQAWLRPPEEVLDFLLRWNGACRESA